MNMRVGGCRGSGGGGCLSSKNDGSTSQGVKGAAVFRKMDVAAIHFPSCSAPILLKMDFS